jgi:DNA-directed RNA polymerase specialized sigma24 family protein
LANEYPGLYTSVGVKALLRDYNTLHDRGYDKGDYNAVIMIVDLECAITLAGLTDRQSEILRLIYVDDRTQDDTAGALNITQQTVSEELAEAHRKIAAVYDYWRKTDNTTVTI